LSSRKREKPAEKASDSLIALCRLKLDRRRLGRPSASLSRWRRRGVMGLEPTFRKACFRVAVGRRAGPLGVSSANLPPVFSAFWGELGKRRQPTATCLAHSRFCPGGLFGPGDQVGRLVSRTAVPIDCPICHPLPPFPVEMRFSGLPPYSSSADGGPRRPLLSGPGRSGGSPSAREDHRLNSFSKATPSGPDPFLPSTRRGLIVAPPLPRARPRS